MNTMPYILSRYLNRIPFLLLLLAMVMSVSAQAKPQLSLEQTVSKTTVKAGEPFTYSLRYRCASTTEHCENTKVIGILPATLNNSYSHVAPTDSVHIASHGYSKSQRKVTWTFVNPLPAGSTGELSLTVDFPNGTTENGATATFTPTIEASNADTVTANSLTVTAESKPYITFKKKLHTSNPYIGSDVNYRLYLCNTGGLGTLNLDGVTLTDKLYPNAQFVKATNSGTYDAATHSVTWSLSKLSVGSCFKPYVTALYPQTTFTAETSVTNLGVANVNFVKDGGSLELESSVDHIIKLPSSAGVGFGKHPLKFYKGGHSKIIQAGLLHHNFYVKNQADYSLNNVVISDEIPAELRVSKFYRNSTAHNDLNIGISYKTSINTNWTAVTSSNTTIKVNTLGLAAGEYITALKWEIAELPAYYTRSSIVGFYSTILDSVSVGDIIKNSGHADYDFILDGEPTHTTRISTRNTRILESKPKPYVRKYRTSPAIVTPGKQVKYSIRFKNLESELVNPVLSDLLPANLEFTSWKVTRRDAADMPDPIFTKVDNYQGTGRTLLRWSWTGEAAYTLPIQKWFFIDLVTTVDAAATPGQVANQAYVTAEDPATSLNISSCKQKAVDTLDLNGNGATDDTICATTKPATEVSAVAAMDAVKWVKGLLDTEWHRYPDSGKTSLAGRLDYQLIVKNTGNIPMTNVVVVDILPFLNDTGVIDLSNRDSAWQPQLIGAVQAANGIKVFYSTVENPCRTEVLPTNPEGCVDPAWSAVLPEDITSVRSLRFDFGDVVLAPADELKLTWPMYAPIDAPLGTIAWNSFGYVATRMDTGTQLLPSEPIKVGIEVDDFQPAILGDYIWNDKNGNGIQDPEETGINGVRVELYQPGKDTLPNTADDVLIGFTLSADDADKRPGFYLFSSLEAGQYFVKFYPPVGYIVSPANRGEGDAQDELDSDVNPETQSSDIVELKTYSRNLTVDLGVVKSASAAIGNYVWFDADEDGKQNESADKGINDVTVTLFKDNGDGIADIAADEQVKQMKTANDVNGHAGYYLFDKLNPGQYFVHFELPYGARFTTQGQSGVVDIDDSDVNITTGTTEIVTLLEGFDPSWDAGMILPVGNLSLGNRIWFDEDQNGIYATGSEKGINDVKLTLFRDIDNNGAYTADVDTMVTTTTTFTKDGVKGYYLFDKLPAGAYIVRVDSGNFIEGQPLAELVATTTETDVNNKVDHDSNGIATEGNTAIFSQAITLAESEEGYSELTVDFGFRSKDTTPRVSCSAPKVYGVQDFGLNDSQFFTIDPVALTVEALGKRYYGHDIETLDIHPTNRQIYATSGDDPSSQHPHGYLYQVNPVDGALTGIGSTGLGEVSAISFNPKDDTLWAWADGEGLAVIDITTGKATTPAPSDLRVEALSWNFDGSILYATENRKLWAWDGTNINLVCDDLPGQTEALEMFDENILLFAVHTGNDLNIYAWNVNEGGNSCAADNALSVHVETSYNDVEGISWPVKCIDD